MAKNSEDLKKRIIALHKDGVGYKKIATDPETELQHGGQDHTVFNRTGSTQNRPRHGRPKKLSARSASYPEVVFVK